MSIVTNYIDRIVMCQCHWSFICLVQEYYTSEIMIIFEEV